MTKSKPQWDAIVVGSGPNGLAAAICLAQAGYSVRVYEARDTVGGGTRTAQLTLPGYFHDVCSAIHPLGLGSPFFKTLPLAQYGLEWIQPPAPLAHPLDGGRAMLLQRSIEATSYTLGSDGPAYRKLMKPLADNWDNLAEALLGPFRIPRHPVKVGLFGLKAIRSARGLALSRFKHEPARALFAGMSAHSILALDQPISAAFGLVLGALGHKVGWPLPRGGSQQIAEALAAYLRSLGGEIVVGQPVERLKELPSSRVVLLDITPKQVLKLAGDRLPNGYRKQLEGYRYGPGVFKMDFALDGPIPWQAAECSQAATVHVGGTLDEISLAEKAVSQGRLPEKPFVLLAQPSLFDSSRTPAGKSTIWAYCHVPNGSTFDMSERIELQIERFAPGFRDRILARSVLTPADLEKYNSNYIGGDINGGLQDWRQLFTRPAVRLVPYSTPSRGLYLCSSSTPPGGGVHGMCGYFAAQAAMKELTRS